MKTLTTILQLILEMERESEKKEHEIEHFIALTDGLNEIINEANKALGRDDNPKTTIYEDILSLKKEIEDLKKSLEEKQAELDKATNLPQKRKEMLAELKGVLEKEFEDRDSRIKELEKELEEARSKSLPKGKVAVNPLPNKNAEGLTRFGETCFIMTQILREALIKEGYCKEENNEN